MNLAALNRDDGVLFGIDIPERVNVWLQAAAMRPDDMGWAETNLKRALDEKPDQIETSIALYKLYCYRGHFEEAEAMTRTALARAAAQAGIDPDWQQLTVESADWSASSGPARLFLYSLKALAFIQLRREHFAEADETLSLLAELDPEDRVGASVVRDMAAAFEGDDE